MGSKKEHAGLFLLRLPFFVRIPEPRVRNEEIIIITIIIGELA
jgi:hypothetical protein